jgi:hypothetical protein
MTRSIVRHTRVTSALVGICGAIAGAMVGGCGPEGQPTERVASSSSALLTSPPDPTSSLVLWLDARQGVTQSSGAVSAWADYGGGGHDVSQSTSAYQPTYTATGAGPGGAYPYLTFGSGSATTYLDNTTDDLITGLNARLAVFVVANLPSSGVGGALFTLRRGAPVATFLYLEYSGGSDYAYSDGYSTSYAFGSGTLPVTGSPVVLDWYYGLPEGLVQLNVNGTSVLSSGPPSWCSGTTGFTVGSREDYPSQGWIGDIYAVVAYNSLLSSSDRGAARDFLAVQWGICSSGQSICGSCVDEQTDTSNCGACGNTCPGGYTCSSGTCVP